MYTCIYTHIDGTVHVHKYTHTYVHDTWFVTYIYSFMCRSYDTTYTIIQVYTATMKITDSYVHAVPPFFCSWIPLKGFFSGPPRWISPLMPRQNSRRRGLGIPAPRWFFPTKNPVQKNGSVFLKKSDLCFFCGNHSVCTTAAWNLFLFSKEDI